MAEKTVVFGEAVARLTPSNGWHKCNGCDLHLKNEVLAKCILKRSKLLRLPVQPFLAVCVTHHRVFTGIQHSQSLSWPKLTVKLAPVWLRNWFWALCVSVCPCACVRLLPDVPALKLCRYVYAAAEWACRISSRWSLSLVTTAGSCVLILGCRRRGLLSIPPLSIQPRKLKILIFKGNLCVLI